MLFFVLELVVMSRVKTGRAKPTISFRLRREILNVSKEIPGFRDELEKRAEELYRDYLDSKKGVL